MKIMDKNVIILMKKYKIEFVIVSFLIIMFFQFFYRDSMAAIYKKINFEILMLMLMSIVFLVAMVSYPKIYKFKMLLSAFVLGAFIINFIILDINMPSSLKIMGLLNPHTKSIKIPDNFALKFLLTLLNLNFLFIIISNSYVTYNTGKTVSWTILAVNLVLYQSIVMLMPLKPVPEFVVFFNKYNLSINIFLLLLIVLFSFFNIEEEHNYGSIIVALSLIVFYCNLQINYIGKLKLMMPIMSVLLIWGMFAHWITCLQHKAHYDPLLKIYNRQYMNSIADGLIDVKLGNKFSVLMCDIDHFKEVNDNYGHMAGDEVLYRVAQIIREASLPEGVACRYGGEEIIIFLRDKTGDDAYSRAEKIRKTIKKTSMKFKSKTIKVTMSIGVASTKNGISDIHKVIKRADENVYKAKKAGRDKVVI
ncbi:MAG: GGDEF domain-containing protein [Candidatus Goldbacteria bacterium]|nr:GGDEF domain-containing protein [Candidatus Goldiibacteriota bacterium]